jgi:hypothetical protein
LKVLVELVNVIAGPKRECFVPQHKSTGMALAANVQLSFSWQVLWIRDEFRMHCVWMFAVVFDVLSAGAVAAFARDTPDGGVAVVMIGSLYPLDVGDMAFQASASYGSRIVRFGVSKAWTRDPLVGCRKIGDM